MFGIVESITISPNFQITQIAYPEPHINVSPLYNSTNFSIIPLVVLPPGGIYKFSFSSSTFLEITLDRFMIQQIKLNPMQINQDNFAQQSYNTLSPIYPINVTNGYTVTRNTIERLYVQGNGFTINTQNLPESYVVTVSLPTYIPLQISEMYTPALKQDIGIIAPTTSFYVNPNIINPQNWVITTPFGIQYTVGISQYQGNYFTIGYDIPDIYGNLIDFTINDMTIPNSAFESTPILNQDFIPQYSVYYLTQSNMVPMVLGGMYNYGNFYNLGYADGFIANYPVFLKEQIQYVVSFNPGASQAIFNILYSTSLRGTEYGIRPYGVLIGSRLLFGYTEKLAVNPFIYPVNTSELSVSLISNADLLTTIISSDPPNPQYISSSSISSQTINQTPLYQSCSDNNVNKNYTNLIIDLLFIVLILALIGGILLVLYEKR